uniref:RNA helicase n=1 Tax=Macrostomum lignano TaxID=282301 RepID=A0A1I8II84_9PLAT
GFVGVLGLHAAMFYWDQCFLTDFASATIEDAALAALFLLRDRFMSAQDYPQMKSVFLNGPREIYTADFIRAWCHLQDRGDPSLVPEMNRRKLEEPPPPDPEVGSPTPVPATPLQPIPLPGLWIDLVSLKLQLMKDGARQKLLASSFSEKHLTVEIRRRYGAVGINSHLLRQRGELKPIEDQTEFRTLQLPYDDKCDFPEVDQRSVRRCQAIPHHVPDLSRTPAGRSARLAARELPDFDEDDPEERQQAADYRDGLVNAYLGDFSEISLHGYPIGESPSPLVILPPPQKEPAKEKTPSPLPPPPETPPPAEEPEPVRQPKNIPRRHWTIHDPAIEKTYPQATATNQPFDVYIDQIRYMFDGITIVKLTGRFLNTGHDTEIPDILLVPNPKLSPRNLNFFAGQRVQITASDAMNLGKDSALVIRVYTLIKPDLEMVVVGTCVLPIFDNKGRLLTGGHQLRLREHASMVAAGQQRASLATSLDSIKQAKSLPCVTGLFRLLPQSARPIDAPDYTSGYYRSEECRPTDAELRIRELPGDVRPLVNYVQSQDTVKVAANDYNQVMAYVPTRMDPARCLPPNTAPRAMPQELHFHYRDLSGAFVRLEAAYGLPKPNSAASADLIFGVLMTIVGAKKLESLPSKALGIGFDTMAVFVQSGAGRFTRRAEQLNPRSDPANTLLVQFFRLPGVAHRDGKLFEGEQEVTELKKDHFVAWAVCPLLNQEYTYNGRHRVPVFSQSDLPLTTNRVRTIRSRGLTGALKVDGALATHVATSSALLSVVDGHLSYKEAPENAKIHTSVYEHLPKTTAADYQPAIDSAQLEQSSFGQNCQEAIENAILPSPTLDLDSNSTRDRDCVVFYRVSVVSNRFYSDNRVERLLRALQWRLTSSCTAELWA